MVSDVRNSLLKEIHSVPDNWNWEWFTDVMDIEGGTQPPASTFIDIPAEGYVRLVQIRDFDNDSHITFIPDSHKWRKCQKSDVLIGRYGAALGRICRGLEGAYNVALATVITGERVYLDFVYQLLRSDYFQLPLQAGGARSAQAGFNKSNLAVISLPIPPLSEQKRIAEVLGALDDKIELNRRMNATLEATARALFQSWFVDFDPVRAKLDGRTPSGMDAATAAFFPDSFEESSLGHIPKGWEVGRVSDISEFSRSSINPGEFPEETFDHYSLPAFDEGRTPKAELGSEIMSNKLAVTTNSVLLSKLNPHIPRIWLPDLHETRRSVCSTEFIVASTRSGFSREFIFSLFTNTAFASTYGTLVTGTTGSHQRIRPESVLEMKTIIPTPQLVEAFTHLAKPMFDQINRNIEQSRTLATLRDTLLPKLLSGELSLKEAA